MMTVAGRGWDEPQTGRANEARQARMSVRRSAFLTTSGGGGGTSLFYATPLYHVRTQSDAQSHPFVLGLR